MHQLCNLFEAPGRKIFVTEQVLIILIGLSYEYEAVVALISSKDTLPLMQYVHPTLLAREGMLDQKRSLDNDLSSPM